MTEITVKANTRELTRQLNDLDLLQYQFKPNIRFYLSLKKRGNIE